MNSTLKKVLQALGFFAFGATLLYFVYQSNARSYAEQCIHDNIPVADCRLMDKLIHDFGEIHLFWLAVVFMVFIWSNISRAIRWRMLIEPLGVRPRLLTLFFAIMISYLANLAFPRIGEFVRAGVVARYTGLSAEKIMGTVVLDRLADLIIFALLILIALFIQSDRIMSYLAEAGYEMGSNAWLLPLTIVVAGGVIAWWFIRYVVRTEFRSSIMLKAQKLFIGFGEGLKTISQVKQIGWFVFHSIWIWVMFFLMTYFGFRIFDPVANLGLDAGLTVFVFGALGFVLPSPGGMGTYHFLITEALKLYGVSAADGFSLANILYFAIQLGCNALLGIIGLIGLPLIHRNQKP